MPVKGDNEKENKEEKEKEKMSEKNEPNKEGKIEDSIPKEKEDLTKEDQK